MKSNPYKLHGKLFRYDFDRSVVERLCKSHADKMFVDRNGKTYHVGYIIGGLWLTIYEVNPVEKPA